MKRVGLVITLGGINYGMLLQSFATQQYLDKVGFNTVIIRIQEKRGGYRFASRVGYLLKTVTKPLSLKIALNKRKRRKTVNKNPVLQAAYAERKRCANAFIQESFHNIVTFSSEKTASEEVKNYAAVIVGSDQQWNPAAFFSNYVTLMFVPEEVRKISYATSLGVSNIPKYLKKRGRKFLSRIDFLSVREPSGKKIVDSIIGEKAVVVLDPTLLLTGEEWNLLIDCKRPTAKPYVFCYFLGDNIEYLEAVRQFCLDRNYKMVVVRNVETYLGNVNDIGDNIIEAPSVEEFISYIKYANFVCTDSFHCTIFSIINHRKFSSFYRTKSSDKNSRNARIDDFLGELGLQSHIYNISKDIAKIYEQKIEYSEIDKHLDKLRRDSISFLSNALE